MGEWARILLNAALFKTEAYEWVARRRDAFYLGFLTILGVALISGLPAFIGDLVKSVRPNPIILNVGEAMVQIEQGLNQFAPAMGALPPEARADMLDQIEQGLELGQGVARDITALPRPLPAPIGSIFEAIGRYVARPFTDGGLPLSRAALGIWLGYGIWVMLFAKLLGGRAGLVSFFGATALYAVPFLLTAFSFLPVLGPLLSLIAFVWGLLIYVKSTRVSHRFGYGRSIVAVFLPLVIAIFLIMLWIGSIGVLIAVAAAGN